MAGMKPRHAAALVLVGWYLMVPPLIHVPKADNPAFRWTLGGWRYGGVPETTQPYFAEWRIVGTYDTAGECQDARSRLVLTAPQDLMDDPKDHAALLASVAKLAECIATDDPRLKEK
jgi:hypothetical protein